jgi:MFS family permease
VVLLGFTSLFTDLSAEMVATVLPIYLVYSLGYSPLQLGIVNGLYEGGAAVVRLASGHLADRRRRHKEVAVAGYGLSAVSKLGLLMANSAGAIGGIVVVDRAGKGIRTAPRDALISLSTPKDSLGTAFGVHRALDTCGALLGPIVAFAILAIAPLAFDAVFMASFAFAIVGLAVIVLFVQSTAAPIVDRSSVSLRAAFGLLRNRDFRAVFICGSALGAVTIGDALFYLVLQRRTEVGLSAFPLLFVGTALVFMLAAVPVGRLADRVGRRRVFVAGYLLLLVGYAALLVPLPKAAALVIPMLALGLYYSMTDGVLAALTSAFVPEELRASALALVSTAVGLARLVASVAFGALWAAHGAHDAVLVFAIALVATIVGSSMLLRRNG